MGIAIKNLLSQEFFQDFQVIAGSQGLDKEAQGIAVLDAPDAFRWSRGKELIISSGYCISKEPDCIRKAFKDGLMQKVSGMMIKQGRYLEEIPEDMTELFDRYGIPLILMPFEIAYMDVMKQVNTVVMNRTIRRFQIQQNGAFSLSNTTYKIQKIKKILQAVEVEMNFPAFLYDIGEQEGYYSSVHFKRISEYYGLRESDYWNPRQEHTKYILCDYLQMQRIRLVNEDGTDQRRVSWILLPISVGGVLQAYFVIMESREFLDYYDEYSLRIAYLLLQAVYEQIVVAQSIGNIGFENFVLLLLKSPENENEHLLYQANQQGLSMNTRYGCILFRQTAGMANARKEREAYLSAFQNSCLSRNAKLAFLDENIGMILIEVRESEKLQKESLSEAIRKFEEAIRNRDPKIQLEFAICREERELRYLKESVEKCTKVLRMGRKLYPKESVWDYEMLGPFAWFQIPEAELDLLLQDYRKILKEEKNIELLRTLKVYLENNMNYSVTAEKMYVHINTIRKRISKLEGLLEIDYGSYISRLKAEVLLQFMEL